MIATLSQNFNSKMPAINEFDIEYMEGKIDSLNNTEKQLSIAIKNLYKTGYYEDVKIY